MVSTARTDKRSLLDTSVKANRYQSITFREEPIIKKIDEPHQGQQQGSQKNLFSLSLNFKDEIIPGLTGKFTSFSDSNQPLKWSILFVLLYLLVGVIIFHGFEDFTTIQALYFAIVTSTTLGYGDMTANNDYERLFMIFYILVGAGGLGVFLGVVGDKLVESRSKETEEIFQESRRNLIDLLNQDEAKINAMEEEKNWNAFKGFLTKTLIHVAVCIGLAIFLGQIEGWPIITSIYFWSVTSTSVGYGDITPREPLTQLFCVFYIPLSIAVTSKWLMGVAELYMNAQALKLEKEFMSRPLTTRDLTKMDTNFDGVVDFGEFLSHMLIAMKNVDKKVVDDIRMLFDKLDKDGNGCLSHNDLKRFEDVKTENILRRSEQSIGEILV